MKTQTLPALLLCLMGAACGGLSADSDALTSSEPESSGSASLEPASSEPGSLDPGSLEPGSSGSGTAQPASSRPVGRGAAGVTAPPVTPTPIPVEGRLEGRLLDMRLSGNTSVNEGTFDTWKGGGALDLRIAAAGNPSGAAMLIVAIHGPSVDGNFANVHWSSTDTPTGKPTTGLFDPVVVTSFAGSEMGIWPTEQVPDSYEISATEDPAKPGIVVLVVKATFPASDLAGETETTALSGTYRFNKL